MRISCCALLALAALPLPGAVIRGNVVDNQTGRALARTAVSLQPVAGTPSKGRSVRTNRYGNFEFDELAGGAYVIRAARRGFMPMEYGQKLWNSAGRPLTVGGSDAAQVSIRLPRYPGITGTVVDENDVGLPDMEVTAYRATQPPELVARGTSDDRGVYRIPGLTPGTYLVRSAASRGEFADYLPTFARETLRVDEAHAVDVYMDDDARNVDVRPAPGRLFTLSGIVTPALLPVGPITVTLASDMGRQISQGDSFQFRGLPPGSYEVYAEAPEDAASGARFQSGYVHLSVGGNTSAGVLLSLSQPHFECIPAPGDKTPLQIMARRLDLAGAGPAVELRLTSNRAQLGMGRWELMLLPPPGYYVSAFAGAGQLPSNQVRPDGWNETEIRTFSSLRFWLTGGASVLRGVVKSAGEAVAGAPVYLEAYEPTYRKRLLDLRVVRSDLHGAYTFDGLAPGTYRVLATFEYQNPDTAAMDLAQAVPVQIEAHANAQTDLTLYELH
jgi:hypothetical protein